MKIAILVSMFPPKWLGGVEIATQNIARHLATENHEVHVITSLDGELSKESQEDNFLIHRIYYPKIKFIGVIFFWLKCLLILKKVRPELVHSQTIQMGLPCFLAKLLFNVPYVVYCHGSDVYLPWKFKRIISKLVLENAKAVIVLTENMKKEIESFNFNIKNVFIIPNGIELEKFKDLSKTNIRRKLKLDETENVILFVGTLKTVKGIKYLIEALSIVREKGLKAKLLLVGDGEQKEELKGMSKKLNLTESINFVGKIDNKEIPEYMEASDVLVLSSLSEGLPVTVLEAIASGLSIIATRVGGLPEIIKDGENGFLIDSENSKQIAEKILYLFSNDGVKKIIFSNNKEKAKNYSWEVVIEKLIKVYSLCLTKK